MNENDRTRLQHMLDYARDVVKFTEGRSRETLDDDLMLVRALTYTIGVIGEAANNISREVQEANPQVPWPQIIAMRNRLMHGYFDINLDRLWLTATEAVPTLIPELEKILY